MSAASAADTLDLFGNLVPAVDFDFRPPREETFVTADLGELIAAGKKFGAILADPAWVFETYSEKGKQTRSPELHYACMSLDDIKALPVQQLAAPDCALLVWTTMPRLPDAIDVMRAWGFKYKTVGFTWVKTTPSAKFIDRDGEGLHWGTGYWTRANAELCLLAGRGAPKRRAKNVHQVVMARVGDHSRKPEEVSTRIERLIGGPYLELFARRSRQGWTVWGDEIDLFKQEG
jgi:N6-adenosine-specific RNA methylase IME4